MAETRGWLILPLLALALLALGWSLFKAPAAPRNCLAESPLPEDSSTGSSRLARQQRPSSLKCAPAHEAEAAQSATPFVDDDPLVAEQPLWKPDYGTAISAPGGSITLNLRDAHGELLDPSQIVDIELVRKLGRFAERESGGYYGATSRFVAAGPDGFGIEPGEYEYCVNAANYGSIKGTLQVGRGQHAFEEVRLPRWRRIVCLKCETPEGAPVEALGGDPTYICRGADNEGLAVNWPGLVLRDDPRVTTESGDIEVEYEHRPLAAPAAMDREAELMALQRLTQKLSKIIDRIERLQRFATKDGLYYVEVFAGGPGEITIRESVECLIAIPDETFEGPQWDNFRVVIANNDEPEKKSRPLANEDDPGRASLLKPRHPLGAHAADDADLLNEERVPEGKCRIIVRIKSPVPCQPELTYATGDRTGDSRVGGGHAFRYSEALSCWWADVEAPRSYYLHVGDGQLLYDRQITTPRQGTRMQNFEVTLTGNWLSLDAPSPTAAAMATRCAFSLGDYLSVAGLPLPADKRAKAILSPDQVSDFTDATRGKARFALGPMGSNCEVPVTFTLNAEQRKALATGDIQVAAKGAGLLLRAVGPQNEGLPWVYATLLEAEEDVTSKRVRQSCLRSGKPEGEASRFFASHETWYVTATDSGTRMLASDARGYMFNEIALTPGKRYVLYLWSNSRDELRPDKRIDFVASDGITDLGAVTLPGYEK